MASVALIGSVSSSLCVLRGLIRGGVEVSCVIGLDPDVAINVSDFCDVWPHATAAGIPYLGFQKIGEPAVSQFLRNHQPDLLFVVGLSQLAPDSLIAIARAGAIGFHPTPLPKGRGRAPVAWTILLQQPAAANLFFLTDEADAGDIIDQRAVEVRAEDYAQDLIDRTNAVLEQMTFDLAPAIKAGKLPRRPQNHAEATWYGKRTPEDGRIDWTLPVEATYRLIRAVSRPYPGGYAYDRDQKLIVWRARPHEQRDHIGTIGQIQQISATDGVLVQCGDGLLWLTDVTDESGKAISPRQFRVGSKLIGGLEGDLRAARSRTQT